ncbi:MAG: hypothetical protein HC922_04690 [Leptolyngbyaceae cyanobacterium SM2_3_12]|nr:hypothetical protein [Leptolyngbyaceae cyanobacterium SM2_3_12]
MGKRMQPDDPNFPEEIPPIPDPQSEAHHPDDGVGSAIPPEKPLVNPLEDWSPADVNPEPALGEPAPGAGFISGHRPGDKAGPEEIWTEEDLSEPDMALPVAEAKTYGAQQPNSSTYQTGSTDLTQRELETPVNPRQPSDDWVETGVPYQPKELGIIDQLMLALADGLTLWRRFLRWVRAQLPPNLQRQLSDDILTAIALGVLMLFIAIWNPLGAGRSQPTARVQPLLSVAVSQPEAPEAEPSSIRASPTESPAAELAPTPELSPEQTLIASIQAQVSDISRSYSAGLIQSVEVNLPTSALTVNVGENWYGLLPSQQDAISQDILTKAQGLEFRTLTLRDPEGVIVARNPVVGSRMVVLHRIQGAETSWLMS